MQSIPTKTIAYLQLVPLASFFAFAAMRFASDRMIASGDGDGALLPSALLLIPVAYFILPAFFLANSFLLVTSLFSKDYARMFFVLSGLILVIGSYLVMRV